MRTISSPRPGLPPLLLPALLLLLLAFLSPAARAATAVATGDGYNLFLMDDGTVWAAGINNLGQLGDGTTLERHIPVQVMTDVKAIAAGHAHSLFLKNDGTVWAAGANLYGQFGNGTVSYYASGPPVQVMTDVKAISVGYGHSLFLKTDGTLLGSGNNGAGQFGPRFVLGSPVLVMNDVQAMSAGENFSLYLKTDGTAWASGYDYEGELGDGNGPVPKYTSTGEIKQVLTDVQAVSAGYNHSLFLKNDGTVWGCGSNGGGQFNSTTSVNIYTPVQMASDVKAIAAGVGYSIFLKNDGTLTPASASAQTVRATAGLSSITGVQAMASRYGCSIFLKTDGSILEQGYPGSEMGDGTLSIYTTPMLALTGVQAISAGANHSLFVTTNGLAWSTGGNANGQLGDGTTTSRHTPGIVSSITRAVAAGNACSYFILTDNEMTAAGNANAPYLTDMQAVATGDAHTVFLKTDGTAWTAGYNVYGQLGDGTDTSRYTPVQVMTDVKAVAAGLEYSLFLKTDGSVWLSGNFNNKTPVQILTGVQAIAGGYGHMLFLKTDGSAWAMGANNAGQLGDGTTTYRTAAPVQVMTGVQAIAAGQYHSLFLKTDGSVWGAGYNYYGGPLETTLDINRVLVPHGTPVKVMSSGVTAISAGYQHSLFLKSDGTAWATGSDADGQLGAGLPAAASSTTIPVQFSFGSTPLLWVEYPSGLRLQDSSSSAIDLGLAAAALPAQKTVLVRNMNVSGDSLTGLSAVITGPNASEFTLTAPAPAELAASAQAPLTINFAPAAEGFRQATLTLSSDSPGVTPIVITLWGAGPSAGDLWRLTNFGFMDNQGIAADDADMDHDGMTNLMERACNLIPYNNDRTTLIPGSGTKGLPFVGPLGADHAFSIEYLRQKNAPDLHYTPQFSDDLSTWQDATVEDSIEPVNDQWERVIVRDPAPGGATRYGRVKVTNTP